MPTDRDDRRMLLGMPGYGQITAGSARAFWRASARPDRVLFQYEEGSLLANGFNRLWCQALNLCHRGEQVDYFAMLHADVEAEDFWLDKLIEEMEAKNLDLLGVAVPIKDPKGLTSLALAHPSGDPWRILCRLTMSEVYQLPETFTSADLPAPLLLNTGCWVCRFDPAWARQVRFTISDRIVFNKKLDCYMPQVEPEDWYFSRLCHEIGLKIGATRKVKIAHAGPVRFVNTEPWGTEFFDAANVRESQIAADGFRFPAEIDGWLSYEEGRALADLARGKRVLEIGSYCGRSTVCLAQTACHVVALDPHDGRCTPRPKDTLAELKANLGRYGVGGRVGIVKGTSADMQTTGSRAKFDVIFIDGDHDLNSVRQDIALAADRLAPGGLIAFHDYRRTPGEHDGRWDPGVTEAVSELLAAGGELISTHGTLAVVRPPALVEA